MMKRILFLIILCILISGCSTSIKYSILDKTTDKKIIEKVEDLSALKFQLQDSTVTLAVPSAAVSPALAPGTPHCSADVTDANWWKCFNQVAPHAAIAPSASDKIWVATPDDSNHLYFSTTAISGVPVTGQDTLYSQITIKYTNNTSTIIAGAGAGAVTGFGIAGPYGAAAGFIVAGAGGFFRAAATPPSLKEYICPNEPVDLSDASAATLKPLLYLPLTINAADARPLAPTQDLVLPETEKTPAAACWHTLPNAGHLGDVSPDFTDAHRPARNSPRVPVGGDGWLYRLVAAVGDDPTQAPKGATPTEEYFSSSDARQDFPYSACRNVTLQMTWWKDLSDAIARVNKGQPAKLMVVTFHTVIADPDFVFTAKVKKGGVINFKPDCGANVSLTADASISAAINAAVTATQNIFKAEQTWASSQKK